MYYNFLEQPILKKTNFHKEWRLCCPLDLIIFLLFFKFLYKSIKYILYISVICSFYETNKTDGWPMINKCTLF